MEKIDFSRLQYMFFNDFADFVFTVAGIIALVVLAWFLFGFATCGGCGKHVSRRHTICPHCSTRLKK